MCSVESSYEVLGVSAEELVRARRRELMRWHPDRNPDQAAVATDRLIAIQDAFATLADPLQRASYDAELAPSPRGGWLRGIDIDHPTWRPPGWSWIDVDPVWELRRHRRFFVVALEALPDTESVMISTAHNGMATLVTDRRLFYARRGWRRRGAEIPISKIDRIDVVRQPGPPTATVIILAPARHVLRLPVVLGCRIFDLLQRAQC